MRRVAIRTCAAITERPKPSVNISARLIGELHGERRNAGRGVLCESSGWRCWALRADLPRYVGSAAGTFNGEGYAVESRSVKHMDRIEIGTGCTISKIPCHTGDLSARLVGKLHRKRNQPAGDILCECRDWARNILCGSRDRGGAVVLHANVVDNRRKQRAIPQIHAQTQLIRCIRRDGRIPDAKQPVEYL